MRTQPTVYMDGGTPAHAKQRVYTCTCRHPTKHLSLYHSQYIYSKWVRPRHFCLIRHSIFSDSVAVAINPRPQGKTHWFSIQNTIYLIDNILPLCNVCIVINLQKVFWQPKRSHLRRRYLGTCISFTDPGSQKPKLCQRRLVHVKVLVTHWWRGAWSSWSGAGCVGGCGGGVVPGFWLSAYPCRICASLFQNNYRSNQIEQTTRSIMLIE
jgi:hypothetical protein